MGMRMKDLVTSKKDQGQHQDDVAFIALEWNSGSREFFKGFTEDLESLVKCAVIVFIPAIKEHDKYRTLHDPQRSLKQLMAPTTAKGEINQKHRRQA